MANTITNVTPQLLAQGLMALRERAVMARLVNRGYESMAAELGNVINIPIPSAITARAITPSVTMNSNVDSSPTTVAVTLDQWYEAPFQMSDNDALSVQRGFIPMQASEAIKALANNVDSFILGKHTGIYGAGGTAGTTPFATAIAAAVTARVVLNKQLAPVDDRRAVLDPSAEGNFLSLANILQVDQRGDPGGIIQGTIGHKLGVDWYMDQNVPTFTPGTGWASGFIASTVAGAVGDTTLNIINATASGTIKVGDIFTLTADTAAQQYVVDTAATASATVAVAISFQPPLKTTVATGATLVVVSIPYTANLMFHRDAFAFASRPLANSQAAAGNIFSSQVDPVSGLALRLELSRQYKQDTYSFDILYGAKLVRAALAAKIFG